MRISIISDVHLGYGSGTELSKDAFEVFSEALEKSLGCDAILIGGDLFDSRNPTTETLTKTMELLIKPLAVEGGAKLSQGVGKDLKDLSHLHQQGLPVIAIHGTHERRVKGLMNPVQALEKAGFLVHLHCNGVIIEKGGERVCVHGMSGVPEQFSGAVLDRWRPKPVDYCFNIMMLHQSISPFMYANHLLPLEKIPRGFSLYILGHIHESKKTEYSNSPLIIPGSLITTQLTKEATAPRGFWIMDTKTSDAAFVPLESQRRYYHIEHKGTQLELEKELESLLGQEHDKKPLIRIKGKDLDLKSLSSRFDDKGMISLRQPKEDEPAKEAVGIEKHSMSVRELGETLLEKNMQSAELDKALFGGIFELLANKKPQEALRLLRPQRQH